MNDESKKSPKYIISRLEKRHTRDNFHCGIDVLDAYLLTQASQDMKKNVAVSYTLTENNSNQIIGYYTLSSISILPGELPEATIKKLPRYPSLPGILIGRLARDKQYSGKNIGQLLLLDALKRSLDISTQLGSVAVIVDAKNDKAISFYGSYGFIQFADNHQRLFLPISTIAKLDFGSEK